MTSVKDRESIPFNKVNDWQWISLVECYFVFFAQDGERMFCHTTASNTPELENIFFENICLHLWKHLFGRLLPTCSNGWLKQIATTYKPFLDFTSLALNTVGFAHYTSTWRSTPLIIYRSNSEKIISYGGLAIFFNNDLHFCTQQRKKRTKTARQHQHWRTPVCVWYWSPGAKETPGRDRLKPLPLQIAKDNELFDTTLMVTTQEQWDSGGCRHSPNSSQEVTPNVRGQCWSRSLGCRTTCIHHDDASTSRGNLER